MSADQLTEVFVELPEWPGYRASNLGRVQSARRSCSGKWKSGKAPEPSRAKWIDMKFIIHKGYLYVRLCRGDGKPTERPVHQLVLEAFVGPCPEGMMVRHFPDRDTTNNRINNISWGTPLQNCEDKNFHGTMPKGEAHARAILNEAIVRLIRRAHREGMTPGELALELGLKKVTVRSVTSGHVWKHVTI